MGAFWKTIAKGFLVVGKGAVVAALWASQHPEILQLVVGLATHVPVAPSASDKPSGGAQ